LTKLRAVRRTRAVVAPATEAVREGSGFCVVEEAISLEG
jgi:hypothetical protein